MNATTFIKRWQGQTASELSTAQSFVRELCELLGVEMPHATAEQNYMFERPITFQHGDGSSSAGRIDCYKHGHFVLEAKKIKAATRTKGFDDSMLRARAQAENYARALPSSEGRPPFLVLVDVGNVIELYSEFSRSGATYTPFPDPRSHRIALTDLEQPELRERLRLLWTAPLSLDPARISARITREVASQLAELAKSLEQSNHRPDHVAAFLTRCLFSMFAEDVELLPKGSFLTLLQTHRKNPKALQGMLQALWQDMDQGGFSVALARQVLKFNGKLFKQSASDGYSLLMNAEQIDRLTVASKSNWREVEPAIFGTLLERALDPTERHALGAHYTPRAYVERLVMPTVVEPLRAEWANIQAAALLLASEQKLKEACAQIKGFHQKLCGLRVLDPACGSGNFLYVTLEHLKRLEGEVLNQLEAFGDTQTLLSMEGETVTPQQLLGIELNTRAAALAELVLWIGYLQWHIRTRGNKAVAEPVVHDYGNIECRDAVLAWADQKPARGANGELLTRWDGITFKEHPVTKAKVPDETAIVPQWEYIKPRQAKWPKADFIVGNPPFIGKLKMRELLGDGYVEALRKTWTEVPDSADFVMYWWSKAAQTVVDKKALHFGLITTNSLTMIYNRRIVQAALDNGLALVYAIPDHPWVDSANGAAVRIAMTVGALKTKLPKAKVKNPAAETTTASLMTVTNEVAGDFGEFEVTLKQNTGCIHANLTTGANLDEAVPLQANEKLSSAGVIPHGEGMVVTTEQAAKFERSAPIKPYRNGRDLTGQSRNLFVIDCYGLTLVQVKKRYPKLYQWLLNRVKPERDANRDKDLREKWWLHRRNNEELRNALEGLPRYIATVMTSKHRVFQFLDSSILPDQVLVAIGTSDAYHLGVLSSQVHISWALAQGGTLEDRPRYSKTTCFDKFPFPSKDTGLTTALSKKIAKLAEQIDKHRKQYQTEHPDLTLTGIYNVLVALREGRPLTETEQVIHTQGVVSVLKEFHDELDNAVLLAYGFKTPPTRDELLTRLVELNAQRAEEEKLGQIQWLRPEFQNPAELRETQENLGLGLPVASVLESDVQTWPSELPAQMSAVAELLTSSESALLLSDIEGRFKGKGLWKRHLPLILETLEALGRARQGTAGWRGA